MAEHEEHHEGHAEGGHAHKAGGHGAHGGGGGHAEGEHEGAPEWLISFADNVALLMGFFVILLAMNMKEPQAGGIGGKDGPNTPPASPQMLDMVISIREAFHSPINMNSDNPREAALRQRKLERLREEPGESMVPGPEGDKIKPEAIRPSDYVQPTAVIPFETGSAKLSESSTKTAREAARLMGGKMNLIIEVRGHVSAKESQRNPERGYQLSYERALLVGKLLAEEGVPWSHLRLVACSDGMPRKSRADSPAEHRTNQRVELVIIQERPESDQFSEDGGRSAGVPDGK